MLASSFNDMSVQLEEREHRLKVTNEKLEQLNRTYIDLIGFVSHELKSVLGSAIVSAFSLRCDFNGTLNPEQERALEEGVVLGGASAGGICWFEQGSTDSWHGEDFSAIDALGWLKGSFCPHYKDDNRRRPSYMNMVEDGRLKDGYAATDFAALHFVDGELSRVLTTGDDARVCRVEQKDGEAVETDLEAEAL